jgi:phosphonate transport system permease protein|tara:strand:- start:2276 stop:3235 length:960 start_codon:yes stop_codon:yes gene_type:complete
MNNFFDPLRSWLGIFILIFLFSVIIFDGMINDWGRASQGLSNLVTFFNESLWPPDWSVLEPQAYPVCTVYPTFMDFTCSTAWIGMVETIKIAFVSTVFGAIISLPISLLASRNLDFTSKILAFSRRYTSSTFLELSLVVILSFLPRFLLAAFRSLPSIIWAIFFVILVGFGPLAGVLAMTLYTVGYLGKLQYEAIEGMTKTPLDAAEAMGLSRFEIAFKVVIPECANDLISQAIFMFEYNVRHGTVIGIVGAGGIGYYINLYLKFLQYDKVIAYLIIIFVVVLIIDFISIKARSYFTDEIGLNRPSWKSIFLPSNMINK